jgi:hypothetical protein
LKPTVEHSMKSDPSDSRSQREQCFREIAECERLLRMGHSDLAGLCLALADWSKELRLIHGFERTGSEAERHTRDRG